MGGRRAGEGGGKVVFVHAIFSPIVNVGPLFAEIWHITFSAVAPNASQKLLILLKLSVA
jgi:hypothetical protein